MTENFMTNFAIEFPAGDFIFLSPSALHDELPKESSEIAKKCHIYAILEKPKFFFKQDSVVFLGSKIANNSLYAHFSFTLEYRIDNQVKHEEFTIDESVEGLKVPDGTTSVILGDYPYDTLKFINDNQETLFTLSAGYLAFFLNTPTLSQYKVLYIGQAFGNEQGQRNAIDRLKAHSTLQKILADCLASKPASEIQIGIFQFYRANLLTSMDGRDKSAISDIRDHKRLSNAIDAKISLKSEIAIIEAALIRYFQPEYNIKLKGDLPSQGSKTLQECYKYDISAIAVNLVTRFEQFDMDVQLYSDRIPKKTWHLVQIELHNPDDRKTFFCIGKDRIINKNIIHHKKNTRK